MTDFDRYKIFMQDATNMINKLEAKLEVAEKELEERRMSTPTMNAVHTIQAKLTAALEREAKLVEALEFAASEIHNEFCGQAHHKYCIVTDAALAENKKARG